jgi:uncharacterized Zn finger protein
MTREVAMPDDIEIRAADAAAFMAERNVTVECEYCGHNEWATSDAVNKTGGMAIFSRNLGHQYPCIAFYCKNCGNFRLIDRSVVADWKRKK